MIIDPELIKLPQILDARGNLSFLEGDKHIPFSIKRTYLIYDVPGGQVRGGHAYKEQMEFIICLSGSFSVVIHNGIEESRFSLKRSFYGLLLPSKIWRSMEDFSTNSVALVCSSTFYNPDDYIRNFDTFKSFIEIDND